MDRIIVGVDFSDESAAAARWVADSFAPAAEVVLVHACPKPAPARVPGRRFVTTEELADVAARGARARLEEVAAELPEGAGRVTVEARTGTPADVLAEAARDHHADLVVVGPHAYRGGFPGLLGTTAEGLMLQVSVPVLLVSSPPQGAPRTILAPVDGSVLTRNILAASHDIASQFEAKLVALHVHDTATYSALSVLHNANGAMIRSEALAESRLWLDQYLRLAGVPAAAADLAVAFGEARQEILAMARQTHADLIVMGSHGGGGAIFRRVLGSVAAWVLRHTRQSVLVLHDAQASSLVEPVSEAAAVG